MMPCRYCKKKFGNEGALAIHMNAKHKNMEEYGKLICASFESDFSNNVCNFFLVNTLSHHLPSYVLDLCAFNLQIAA